MFKYLFTFQRNYLSFVSVTYIVCTACEIYHSTWKLFFKLQTIIIDNSIHFTTVEMENMCLASKIGWHLIEIIGRYIRMIFEVLIVTKTEVNKIVEKLSWFLA